MTHRKKAFIYSRYERFWHWAQAFLILFLALTGFEVHGSYRLFGFETAVLLHNQAAWLLIVLIVFTVFWHFTTGEWRQYLPTAHNLRAQAEYYITGIFRNAPHPTRKTRLTKLNPMQRLVYLGLKILFIPVMVVSGLLYMFYRFPQNGQIESLRFSNLAPVAMAHTLGAYILLAFVVVHVYLITTGHTLTSNLEAMITGWEELEEEEEEERKKKKEGTPGLSPEFALKTEEPHEVHTRQ